MKFPIFIISYNRLDCLRKLLEWLGTAESAEPIVIDNGSTYGPLLDWLEQMSRTILVHRFNDNYGPYRVWEQRLFDRHTSQQQPFFLVTDPDVVPIPQCPKDAIPRLVDVWNEFRCARVGLSLRIEGIPDSLPSAADIRRWESSLQTNEIARTPAGDRPPVRCYDSMLDTTFQLNHRDMLPPSRGSGAIRLAHPYQADHLGWQLDPSHLSEEDRFYWKTASNLASTLEGLRVRRIVPT